MEVYLFCFIYTLLHLTNNLSGKLKLDKLDSGFLHRQTKKHENLDV